MRILIFTSKNHIYANYVINGLINKDVFDKHKVVVLEQDWLIPYKSDFSALVKYLSLAGFKYTLAQIVKQYLFVLLRCISVIRNKKESLFFPYYINGLTDFSRNALKRLKSEKSFKYIHDFQPDLIISIFSKEIIPEKIIKISRSGCINLHPALLPFYKGISPVFWSLVNGEKECGSTLHYIDKNIDTGQIIFQNKISTTGFNTEHSLYMACSKLSIEQIEKYLHQILANNTILTIKNSKKGSYFSIPTKKATKQFKKKGYSFFNFKEFLLKDN